MGAQVPDPESSSFCPRAASHWRTCSYNQRYGRERQVRRYRCGQEIPPGRPDQEGPKQELENLKKEYDSVYDRLLRKQAEFENYRKRVDREKSEFTQFASSELMKELLNTLDSFDLALRNASF